MHLALCPFPEGCEPLPGSSWNAYLFSSDHKAASTGRWRPQVKKNARNRDSLWQLWRIMASLSTFPFLAQWQRPNSYFQLVSVLPFPMSSKYPILPRGLSSLEEGDISQNRLYLDWGFLATPVHFLLYLSPIYCLWIVSNMQKWWRKSKAQGMTNTGKGQMQHLTNSTSLWESQGKGKVLLRGSEVSTDKWHLSNWTQTAHFLALNVWLEKATVCN